MEMTWLYIGTDEVDVQSAREIARNWGVQLVVCANCERLQKDNVPHVEGIIVSLDCVPRFSHNLVLNTLLKMCPDVPWVVYGYDLNEELIHEMESLGISVVDRLNSRVFAELTLLTEGLIIRSNELAHQETTTISIQPIYTEESLMRYAPPSAGSQNAKIRIDFPNEVGTELAHFDCEVRVHSND